MLSFKNRWNIWIFIWDSSELIYKYTGGMINISWPIQKIWPRFGPWLFGKCIGHKATKI